MIRGLFLCLDEGAMQITVRKAHETDLPAITAIYGASVACEAASFELSPPDVPEMTRRWRRLVDAGYPYLVAVDPTGTIAGYAYAGAYRPRPAYAATVESTIYVDQAFRRRGVARQLMAALVTACQAKGATQMIAVIGEPDHSPSVALHEDLGFRTVGRLVGVGRKFDRCIDSVLMQKAL